MYLALLIIPEIWLFNEAVCFPSHVAYPEKPTQKIEISAVLLKRDKEMWWDEQRKILWIGRKDFLARPTG